MLTYLRIKLNKVGSLCPFWTIDISSHLINYLSWQLQWRMERDFGRMERKGKKREKRKIKHEHQGRCYHGCFREAGSWSRIELRSDQLHDPLGALFRLPYSKSSSLGSFPKINDYVQAFLKHCIWGESSLRQVQFRQVWLSLGSHSLNAGWF